MDEIEFIPEFGLDIQFTSEIDLDEYQEQKFEEKYLSQELTSWVLYVIINYASSFLMDNFNHHDHEIYAKQLGIDYATYYEMMIGVNSEDYQDILTTLDNQSEPAIIST